MHDQNKKNESDMYFMTRKPCNYFPDLIADINFLHELNQQGKNYGVSPLFLFIVACTKYSPLSTLTDITFQSGVVFSA